MARKSTEAAKAKAAKEKKILLVLSGVFVLALAYGLYTMHGLGGNKAAAAPPAAAATTAATTTTAAVAAPAPAASSAPPGGGAATASQSAAMPLVSAVKPAAGTGQLESFSRFESKDPFAASGPKPLSSAPSGGAPAAAKSTAAAPTGLGAGTTATLTLPAMTTPALPAVPPPTAAVIAVNGSAAMVSTNADFPVSTDPVVNGIFHLVGLTQTTAQVTIVGGSYASGTATLTLKENQPVTLVNTADGKRYTLELFPQGTVAPAAAPTASAPSTTG